MCAWTCLWVMWKTHIRTNTSRFWEIILSLRFFIFQYGIVYHLHVDEHSTRLNVSTGITLVSVSSFPMAVTCQDSQLKKRKTVVKPKLLSDSNVVCCLMWYTSWFSCLQGFFVCCLGHHCCLCGKMGSMQVYGFSWLVLVVIVVIFKVRLIALWGSQQVPCWFFGLASLLAIAGVQCLLFTSFLWSCTENFTVQFCLFCSLAVQT
jgi:hypothetical protein